MIDYQMDNVNKTKVIGVFFILTSLSVVSTAQVTNQATQSMTSVSCAELLKKNSGLTCSENTTSIDNNSLSSTDDKPISTDKMIKSILVDEPKDMADLPKDVADLPKKSDQTITDVTNKIIAKKTKIARQIVSSIKDKNNLFKYFNKNAPTKKDDRSQLSFAQNLEADNQQSLLKLQSYNEIYILPLFVHSRPNLSTESTSQEKVEVTKDEYQPAELKFQFSLKTKLAEDLFNSDADLWFGYTQKSNWQIHNEENSRPFRANDYMPEVFLTKAINADLPLEGKLRMLGIGAVHHSNGESNPFSRSWNRVYLTGKADWDQLQMKATLWKRLQDTEDDNPDIENYYGYGDLVLTYESEDGKRVLGKFRYNPLQGNGSAEVGYTHPLDNEVNLYMKLFHGYGESLIDYNHKDTTFGIGVILND